MFGFGVLVGEKHVLGGINGDGLKGHLARAVSLDIDLFHGTSFRVEPPRAGLPQSELIERNCTISQGLAKLARIFQATICFARLFVNEAISTTGGATQSAALIASVDAITLGVNGDELKTESPFILALPAKSPSRRHTLDDNEAQNSATSAESPDGGGAG
jgi:hypothetical protein